MFLDFFVALFGGIFYSGKAVWNKSESREVQERQRAYDEIHAIVCPPYYLKEPKTFADRWVMLKDIKEEVIELFNEPWEEIVEIYKAGGYCNPHPHSVCSNPKRDPYRRITCLWSLWSIAYNIWLSKQGYISDDHYVIESPSNFGEVGLNPRIISKKYPVFDNQQELIIKMLKVIECNIQEKYPNLNLSLWLHHYEQSSTTPWDIRWSYSFDGMGYKPTNKPW